MRILYAAIDQTVPGTVGGSVHVQAVAEGLARRGHDVHVAVQRGGAWPPGRVRWHALAPPFGRAAFRWLRARQIAALAREMRADLIVERYYNLGGEGVLAARRLNLPAALEVNAPIVDYPGSPKAWLDRALLVQPLRRWRDHVCRLTDLFITPSASILPAWIDPDRVLVVEWGADTDRFCPGVSEPAPFARAADRVYCVFAGAFRSWHGAAQLPAAIARLEQQGDRRFAAVLIGDGPERAAAERAGSGSAAVQFTGRVPHADLPRYLAHADIGVAPFDVTRHAPLQLGFYWSPLKLFEYMASGLPVVAPRLPRIAQLVEHEREGVLYDPEDPAGLERAIAALADPAYRRRLGAAARARAVRDYSWDAHCAALEARFARLVASRPSVRP